jgi:malate dehydrogenase (oxaloacetate-decarboxylating)
MPYGLEAIRLHRAARGKIATLPKMPLKTSEDLALAYTPGVAAVSLAIAEDKWEAYSLTSKGNTVAVVTDGSAVLGLGDIGPEAALPVMEGKAILFKTLADVDAVPCLAARDSQAIVDIVTIGSHVRGINLRILPLPAGDRGRFKILAFRCSTMTSTARPSTLAALINALKVTGRASRAKIVISGAGAAGIAVAELLFASGATNIVLVDREGVIYKDRPGLSSVKARVLVFSNPQDIRGDLAEALRGADVFIGLSVAGLVDAAMVRRMNPDPIVFAMANPVPEIMPDEAAQAGAAVVATGRSDFPNQINNCLAFPGVFRGALDVRAPRITRAMELAAARALASLVQEPTRDYILPWALDMTVAPAVAKAIRDVWQAEGESGQP